MAPIAAVEIRARGVERETGTYGGSTRWNANDQAQVQDMATTPNALSVRSTSQMRRTMAGWLMLGFALGGFFDGILLHQILQWHHLLSGLDGSLSEDLHFQITMDGLFHLVMFVVAFIGAWLLLAAHTGGGQPAATGVILRYVLIGFGAWHIVDALVSHWLLGIHRIRMDSDMPLFWDVAWLVVFGIVPLVAGFLIKPRGGPSRPAATFTMIAIIAAGVAAGAGPRFAPNETIVVFRKDIEPAAMMAAIQHAGATIRWTDASGTIWAVDGVPWTGLGTLYANGALIVSSAPMLAGCLAWTRLT